MLYAVAEGVSQTGGQYSTLLGALVDRSAAEVGLASATAVSSVSANLA